MKAKALAPLVLTCGLLGASVTSGTCAVYDDLNAGIDAYNIRDWASAIASFDRALKAGGLLPDQQYVAHLDRGDALANKGDGDAAIADYSACLGLRAGDAQALLRRANVYYTLSKRDLALQDFDAAIVADPDNASAHLTRAGLYEIAGQPDKELADIEAARPLDPDNKSIMFRVGIAKMEMGRFDEAAAIFEEARKNYPAYAWMWLAFADVKAGQTVPASNLDHLHGIPWPDIVVDFFRGKSSEGEVMKEATGQSMRLCEANFYIGEWHMVHGDAAEGTPLLRKVVDSCPSWQIERFAAIAELRK